MKCNGNGSSISPSLNLLVVKINFLPAQIASQTCGGGWYLSVYKSTAAKRDLTHAVQPAKSAHRRHHKKSYATFEENQF